jgi:dUTP pyrophosphatase
MENESQEVCYVCNGHGIVITHLEDRQVEQECWICGGWGKYREPKAEVKPLAVKIKKLHPEAVIPKYSKPGDAGLDLTAIDDGIDVYPKEEPANTYYYRQYSTGIAVEIPPGYVGLLFPRSSQRTTGLILANCVGVIDSGYRGEVNFRFKVDGAPFVLSGAKAVKAYKKGDRLGQLIIMPYPQIEFEEVAELSPSERGTGGWGSTGK